MENLKKYMDKVIMGICVVLFIFMLIMGSYQIISRYILKDPSTISEELVTYSFTWSQCLQELMYLEKENI